MSGVVPALTYLASVEYAATVCMAGSVVLLSGNSLGPGVGGGDPKILGPNLLAAKL